MSEIKMFPKIVGRVRCFQMDADRNIIPGTEHEGFNTIKDDMYKFLAQAIGSNVLTTGSAVAVADMATIYVYDTHKGRLFLVDTDTVSQSNVTYPVGSYFVSDGTTFTGSGKLKEVLLNSLLNPLTTSSTCSVGDWEDNGLLGYDSIVISATGNVTQDTTTGRHYITDSSDFDIRGAMKLEVNQGGDGDKTYIEFYGELYNDTGNPINITGEYQLVKNMNIDESGGTYHGLNYFEKLLAQYTYAGGSLAAGRRFGFYWRFDFGESV